MTVKKKLIEVALLDGISHLVGLLEGVWRDGLEGLFPVPGATVLGVSQPRHQVDQIGERPTRHLLGRFRGLFVRRRLGVPAIDSALRPAR